MDKWINPAFRLVKVVFYILAAINLIAGDYAESAALMAMAIYLAIEYPNR